MLGGSLSSYASRGLLHPGALRNGASRAAAASGSGVDRCRCGWTTAIPGIVRRSPDALCLVVGGAGHRGDLEPAAAAARQRRGGAEPGIGQELGRAGPLPRRGGVACRLNEEDQVQRQSYPHGSFESRLEAYPSLAHSADSTARRGAGALGLGCSAGLPGGRDRAIMGGSLRQDRAVPWQDVRGGSQPRERGGAAVRRGDSRMGDQRPGWGGIVPAKAGPI